MNECIFYETTRRRENNPIIQNQLQNEVKRLNEYNNNWEVPFLIAKEISTSFLQYVLLCQNSAYTFSPYFLNPNLGRPVPKDETSFQDNKKKEYLSKFKITRPYGSKYLDLEDENCGALGFLD